MKKWIAVLSLCMFFLGMSGCASLNYNEIAPNAKTFKPKIAVVLPTIKMPEGADQEGDKVIKAIYDAAVATKRFERVIDPMTAKFQMVENGQLQDVLMIYTTKLRTMGISDPESSKRIGEILQVDTIIVGDVGKWGYASYRGDKTGEVAIAVKMVDAASGAAYWKASHAAQKTYSLFKPNLEDMAADLAKKIFDFMPKP